LLFFLVLPNHARLNLVSLAGARAGADVAAPETQPGVHHGGASKSPSRSPPMDRGPGAHGTTCGGVLGLRQTPAAGEIVGSSNARHGAGRRAPAGRWERSGLHPGWDLRRANGRSVDSGRDEPRQRRRPVSGSSVLAVRDISFPGPPALHRGPTPPVTRNRKSVAVRRTVYSGANPFPRSAGAGRGGGASGRTFTSLQ